MVGGYIAEPSLEENGELSSVTLSFNSCSNPFKLWRKPIRGHKLSLILPLVSRVDLFRGVFLLQGIALQSIESTPLVNMGI